MRADIDILRDLETKIRFQEQTSKEIRELYEEYAVCIMDQQAEEPIGLKVHPVCSKCGKKFYDIKGTGVCMNCGGR